ncbi:MAG: hypothetical protein JXJ17_12005 [Anaerolineae bacterium]|nr:hypothetical protein [Anaerolineae bacterium]
MGKLKDFIARRKASFRFYSLIGGFLFLIVVIFVISLQSKDYVQNLSLNLFTELIGAVLIAWLLDTLIGRANRDRHLEIEELRRISVRLEMLETMMKQHELLQDMSDEAFDRAVQEGKMTVEQLEAYKAFKALSLDDVQQKISEWYPAEPDTSEENEK